MAKSLLDTDILSEVLRGRDVRVVDNASNYLTTHSQLTISAVFASPACDAAVYLSLTRRRCSIALSRTFTTSGFVNPVRTETVVAAVGVVTPASNASISRRNRLPSNGVSAMRANRSAANCSAVGCNGGRGFAKNRCLVSPLIVSLTMGIPALRNLSRSRSTDGRLIPSSSAICTDRRPRRCWLISITNCHCRIN